MLNLFLDPFALCGSQIGCGANGWLISDSTLSPYVVNATCADTFATQFSSLSSINCQCPTVSISPCICVPTSTNSLNTTLTITCADQGIADSDMTTIVGNIPATTPLDILIMSNNTLTKIPDSLPQYTQLTTLSVASNAITSVATGQVALTANVVLLDFSSNQISSIAAGSLPGEFSI